MTQDQFAIGGGADIELEIVSAHSYCLLEGRERVLRMMQVLTPVGDGNDLPWLRLGRHREQRQQA
jgi:hypothetical protein